MFLLSSMKLLSIPGFCGLNHASAWRSDPGKKLSSSLRAAASSSASPSPPVVPVYTGPVLHDPTQIIAGVSLGELGLDLYVAPSMVAPGQLGLFAILAEDTARVTLPECALLCGYARQGTFATKDEGDKTVGFVLAGPHTAVYYDQQLMSVIDALTLAAETKGANQTCGLAGHVLIQKEENTGDTDDEDTTDRIEIHVDNNPEFARYFIPSLANNNNDNKNDEDENENENAAKEFTVQNLGQFCNDLAWNYDQPPQNHDEYDTLSDQHNAVQLVWRLEFCDHTNSLIPSWPVSVLAQTLCFENTDTLQELGTRYGWNYWQATVDLETV